MINISAQNFSENIPVPSFVPSSSTLHGVQRNIPGLDSRIAPTDLLLENYADFAGVERTSDWLYASISSGISSLEKKIGTSNAVSDLLAIETSYAKTRMYSASFTGAAQFQALQQVLANAVDNADYEMDEASFKVSANLNIAQQVSDNDIALSTFEKTGEVEISRMGYLADTGMAKLEADTNISLATAIIGDDYTNTRLLVATKSAAEIDMEENFSRPQELLVAGLEEDNNDTLNLLDISGMNAQSSLQVQNINATANIEVLGIQNSSAVEIAQIGLASAADVMATNQRTTSEVGYILANSNQEVITRANLNNINILADSLQNNAAIQLGVNLSNVKISSANTLANANAAADAKLANVNVANNIELTTSKINGDYQLTAANIISDAELAQNQVATSTSINNASISNAQSITAIEILTDAQSTANEILN